MNGSENAHQPSTVPRFWQLLSDCEPTEDDLAEDFHEASKFYRSTMGRMVRPDRLARSEQLHNSSKLGGRELPHLRMISLPQVDGYAGYDSLERSTSCRSFSDEPISIEQLSRILWMMYGASRDVHPDTGGRRRPVASGGALYPLEIYLVADVHEEGSRGVYHYNIHHHALEEVSDSIDEDTLARLGQPPELVTRAPVAILIMGLFWRSRFKYGLRGYRFALLEAGAVIHQASLAANALGLSVLPFAGIFDDVAEEICEVDGVDEAFINALLLGHPKRERPC